MGDVTNGLSKARITIENNAAYYRRVLFYKAHFSTKFYVIIKTYFQKNFLG